MIKCSIVTIGDVQINNPLPKNTCSFTEYCRLLIIISLHMSVITQDGESPLMKAAWSGSTEVVSLLVKAGAALDLQSKVNMWH